MRTAAKRVPAVSVNASDYLPRKYIASYTLYLHKKIDRKHNLYTDATWYWLQVQKLFDNIANTSST